MSTLLKRTKEKCFAKLFNENIKDTKKIWIGIKSLVSIKNKNNDTPSIIRNDGKYINDPITNPNSFNNFFTSIADAVQSKIRFLSKSFRSLISTNPSDSFIITATDKKEVWKAISSLSINKSCGVNSIPTKILHLVEDQISKHLATICNLSVSTGICLTILKTAKVIPIHKKDSKLEVSNCRPISLLSNIDKIFEN